MEMETWKFIKLMKVNESNLPTNEDFLEVVQFHAS